MLIHPIKYSPNSTLLFEKIAHEQWAIFLDSGQPQGQYGRYDIMVARPFITLTTLNNRAYITRITRANSAEAIDNSSQKTSENISEEVLTEEDPFALIKRLIAPYSAPVNQLNPTQQLPFSGGAVGYFGYDLARYLEALPNMAQDNAHIPELSIGIYDWALVVDHREQVAYLVSHGHDPYTHQIWPDLCALFDVPSCNKANKSAQMSEPTKTEFKVLGGISSNMTLNTYASAFNKIKHYIIEGDCYQVNLAQRFAAKVQGDAWLAFQKLREISPAPFMAYMNLPNLQVLSGSPERFLQVTNSQVETRPIKGTRPRSSDALQDAANAKELLESVKDQAENLMIVDLLRNDISKSCEVGSVKANTLFSLQSFANVHHLVSIVTGTLAQGKSAIDLLRGCFPGGSITGAPKLRAMEIIEELEPHRRGLYCGAIGYIGFDGNMDSNIAIRTMMISDNTISFYAGGGIVADSEMLKEYNETWDKAASMLKLLQFFGARPEKKPDHVDC